MDQSSRRRLRHSLALMIATVFAANCYKSTCSCLPDQTQQSWIAITSVGDSVALELIQITGGTMLTGSGTLFRVRPPFDSPRMVSVTGEWNPTTGAPRRLEFTGWLSTPIAWTSTTSRTDSLYGVLRLPPGVAAGDTLGLFLRRR